MTSLWYHALFLPFMIIGASPLAGQYYQASALATPVTSDASMPQPERNPRDTRPPLPRGAIPLQILSGGAGGLGGAFTAFVPFALAGMGGRRVSDDASIAAALIGYYVGSVAGVQLFSRSIGLEGSWKATFLGAALGVLGGPAVLVTMPVGATIGFNRTRRTLQ